MTTHDEDGPELAQALDSLTDALSRAVRHAQQEDSAFQIAPVELILQVTVSQAEPQAGGAEWRVLGHGSAAPPGAAGAHSLTMRFTPRDAQRHSAGPGRGTEGAGQPTGQTRSSGPPPGAVALPASAGSVGAPGAGPPRPTQGWPTALPASAGSAGARGPRRRRPFEPPGAVASSAPAGPANGRRPGTPPPIAGPPTAVAGTAEALRAVSGPAEQGPGPGLAAGPASPAVAGGAYAVRLSCYLDEAPGERPRCLVERAFGTVSAQEAAKFAPMADQPDAVPGGRERLVDAIAQYAADRADNAFPPVRQQWEIRGMFNPAAASGQLGRLQEWLRELVQRPLEDTSAQLGLAPGAAGAAGGVGANIVVAPVDRAVGHLTKIIDIVGIVGGAALGMHPIALVCLKHLLHSEFHDLVAKAVIGAFDGLVVGSKEVPTRFPGDLGPPRSLSVQPYGPAPTDRRDLSPRTAPDRPTPRPVSPAQRPPIPPQPPAPRPASPKPWHRGEPGMSGPGGP